MENSQDMVNDQVIGTSSVLSRTKRLSLSIGGISCSIISQDTPFLNLLRTRYQWFESSGPATYEILLQVVPISNLNSNGGEKNPRPAVRRMNGEDYLIRRTDNPFVAIFNTSSRKALVKMWHSQYCFDGFLRTLYGIILAKEGGVLLHASAISYGGRGRVFFGPSGSGKTTVARLSRGGTILTDELALVKPRNGKYRVYGTPFWGEFTPGRSNTQAELGGLYSLKKATQNRLVPLDRVQAVMELYRCVLFFGEDSQLLSQILDTCCALADRVPVYELYFRPDPAFWQLVDEGSQERGEHHDG